jgi:hypothetical protein
MRNNLFKQVLGLITKYTNTGSSSPVMPSVGLNQNMIGTQPVIDTGVASKLEELSRDINTIKTNLKGISPRIISGMEVKASFDNKVNIKSGSVYLSSGLYEFAEQTNFVIDNSTIGTRFIVVENGAIKQVPTPNDDMLLIAKIVINIANGEINDDANSGYTNNYIVSGRDLAINPQLEIDDDTKLIISNVLKEILASNLVGTIRLNEGLNITNQQDSVRLNSTGMEIYNDEIKYASFNRDGIYFYNNSGLMLSQYTKDGATVGNISIQPNSIQSTNFLTGNKGFQIKSDGNVEFNNITARGTIVARDGKIGGWTIGQNELYAGSGDTRVGLRPGTYPLYAGSNIPSSAPFRIDNEGNLYAQNGIFKGQLQSTVMITNSVNVNSGDLLISSASKIDGDINDSQTLINILDSSAFSNDDLLKLDLEVIRVISISGTQLTVSRAFDTSAVLHLDGTAIYKIGEYDTEDKGYIELIGTDNQIIIHDVDADTTSFTDTKSVILGKQTSGKYGLKMIEGEIGLNKHSYDSNVAGIWMGEDTLYKLNIGSEYKYLKWNGTDLELRGNIVASRIEGRLVGEDNLYLSYQFLDLIDGAITITDSTSNLNNGTASGYTQVIDGVIGNGIYLENGAFSQGFSRGFSLASSSATYITSTYAHNFTSSVSIVIWTNFKDNSNLSVHGHSGSGTNLYIGCENEVMVVGVGEDTQTLAQSIPVDEYVCLGLTVDGTTKEYKSYYNGDLVYTGSYTSSASSAQLFVFGGLNTISGVINLLYGYMDELKIYTNQILTDEEMSILYTSPTGEGIYIDSDIIINGGVDALGYITGKKCGVFAYLSSASSTTITTAGTYEYIRGNFVNSPIECFSLIGDPAIKYDGEITQFFEMDWHASVSANVAGTEVSIGIKKNDILVTSSIMTHFLKNINEVYTMSGTTVVELAPNDRIQLVVTSDGNSDVITFEHYTTTINEFFD